ncbi:hypothetical protein D3C71_600750 [compost metagenome]
MQGYRGLAGLEHHHLALVDEAVGLKAAFGKRQPSNGVTGGRLVGPVLARLESHQEVVDAGGCRNRTLHALVRPDDDVRRPGMPHRGRFDVATHWRCVLQLGRQGKPKLEPLHPGCITGRNLLAVPDAAPCTHPLHAAVRQRPGAELGITVAGLSFGEYGHGGDARMRVQRHIGQCAHRFAVNGKGIQEHKRLQPLAKIRGTHQAGDWTVSMATGPVGDTSLWQGIVLYECIHQFCSEGG